MATAEFTKAAGILGGLWEKVRREPGKYLDEATIATEGLDAAAKDFLAGMTDRYAVALYEQLFIPKPWVAVRPRLGSAGLISRSVVAVASRSRRDLRPDSRGPRCHGC